MLKRCRETPLSNAIKRIYDFIVQLLLMKLYQVCMYVEAYRYYLTTGSESVHMCSHGLNWEFALTSDNFLWSESFKASAPVQGLRAEFSRRTPKRFDLKMKPPFIKAKTLIRFSQSLFYLPKSSCLCALLKTVRHHPC
ncbi:uncharacterized protein V6R79_002726 [Siganus canaliculatus]